eukprot:s91_g45.t1
MHQEKYIMEKIFPHKLPKGKMSDKTTLLLGEDFEIYRSLLYKVNWVAHQTRPEAAGVVSLLASRLHQATVHDLCCLNKMAVHLRNTAKQSLTLHSDAGGIDGKPVLDNKEDTVQGAWIIMASDSMPSASHKVKVSVLSWRSAKLRRRVSSTLAGEALAFSQALGELEWLQIMFRDVVFGDVSRIDWQTSLSPFLAVTRKDCSLQETLQQCGVVDAKSLFDNLKKQSPTSRQDRRTSIEVAIIIEAMRKSSSCLRWCPHPRMVADTLTKDDIGKSNGALEELMKTSRFALWDEEDELARRKEDPRAKGRSKRASESIRSDAYQLFAECHDNRKFGELRCEDTNVTTCERGQFAVQAGGDHVVDCIGEGACSGSNFVFTNNSNISFTCSGLGACGVSSVPSLQISQISLTGESCIDLSCSASACGSLSVSKTSTDSCYYQGPVGRRPSGCMLTTQPMCGDIQRAEICCRGSGGCADCG